MPSEVYFVSKRLCGSNPVNNEMDKLLVMMKSQVLMMNQIQMIKSDMMLMDNPTTTEKDQVPNL